MSILFNISTAISVLMVSACMIPVCMVQYFYFNLFVTLNLKCISGRQYVVVLLTMLPEIVSAT